MGVAHAEPQRAFPLKDAATATAMPSTCVASAMRVTVCQLPDAPEAFEAAWTALARHIEAHAPQLVLLPEMPAPPWFCAPAEADPSRWDEAVDAHEALVDRLPELGAPHVVTSRPVERGGRRVNEAIHWSRGEAVRAIHEKRFLPDEPGWHEARWYEPGTRGFQTAKVADATVGTLVCTDVMFNEHARALGRDGAHLLLVPRASEGAERWPVACRMAAIASGGYVLSSNRSGPGHEDASITWGGDAVVVDPEGRLLARTTQASPFATVDVDLSTAEAAKQSYPRYVEEPA